MKPAHDVQDIQLTSTELGSLWTVYMNNSMSIQVLTYFLNKVEDKEIHEVLKFALESAQQENETVINIFNAEGQPIPHGFTEDDVNINARRLYSDNFFLHYVKNMSQFGMTAIGTNYTMASRSDIRNFYKGCVQKITKLDEMATQLLLAKGLYTRAPYITITDKVSFVNKQNFLAGFIGGRRPLIAMEATYLFLNAQTNSVGNALLLGFSQVAGDQRIRKYTWRGMEIAKKHLNIFTDKLREDHLHSAPNAEDEVTDSTEAPFSDKLMIFHITLLVSAGMGNYGMAMAVSPRHDLSTTYARLAAEVGDYAADGANIMIDNGWMEEPPQADDRKEIANKQ
ncbi:MAG TPA: DUF3231 family protein [Bacillales bacterium]|nr:DUF3231 family protein [Bacillales bacterium]